MVLSFYFNIECVLCISQQKKKKKEKEKEKNHQQMASSIKSSKIIHMIENMCIIGLI